MWMNDKDAATWSLDVQAPQPLSPHATSLRDADNSTPLHWLSFKDVLASLPLTPVQSSPQLPSTPSPPCF